MKIGVTGPRGRLASCLVHSGCIALDCDITDARDVAAMLDEVGPLDALINAAAWTWVDGAEDPDNRDEVLRINMTGPAILRKLFAGPLIQISTGFVFDGKDGPYDETGKPHPVNWYGWTKLGGECAALIRKPTLIVRVLDLFGLGPKPDFVSAIKEVLDRGEPYDLPEHLYGSPTFVPHLTEAILAAVRKGMRNGIVNICGDMVLSRYEWGVKIAEYFGYDPEILRPSQEIKGVAPRPLRGGLTVDRAKEFGLPIYSPIDGLATLAERRDDT